jgi:carbonic anhydrase/acetyltransferase-like protein (isoleucine patch superfamily)
MTAIPYDDFLPSVAPTAFIAPGVFLIGRVTVGDHSSVWFNSVARADINSITIGDFTNIQDGSLLHVGDDHPCTIGSYVTVGHGARLHGCAVEDGCLIGINAVVLNGARVGEGAIVGAGALIPEGKSLRAGHLYVGVPAKELRQLTPEEIEKNRYWAEKYARVAAAYLDASGALPTV